MPSDRYIRVILTVIAAALVWIGVVLAPIGTPVSAQLGPTPVVLTGWQDASGRIQTFNASPLPLTMATPAGSGTAMPAPLVSQPPPAASTTGTTAPRTTTPKQQTAVRCQATTQKGTQCSRMAKAGSDYCWQHGG